MTEDEVDMFHECDSVRNDGRQNVGATDTKREDAKWLENGSCVT